MNKEKNMFRKGIKSLKNDSQIFTNHQKISLLSGSMTSSVNQLSYSFKGENFKHDLIKKPQPKSILTKNSLTASNKIISSKFLGPGPITPSSNRPLTSKQPLYDRKYSQKDKQKIRSRKVLL